MAAAATSKGTLDNFLIKTSSKPTNDMCVTEIPLTQSTALPNSPVPIIPSQDSLEASHLQLLDSIDQTIESVLLQLRSSSTFQRDSHLATTGSTQILLPNSPSPKRSGPELVTTQARGNKEGAVPKRKIFRQSKGAKRARIDQGPTSVAASPDSMERSPLLLNNVRESPLCLTQLSLQGTGGPFVFGENLRAEGDQSLPLITNVMERLLEPLMRCLDSINTRLTAIETTMGDMKAHPNQRGMHSTGTVPSGVPAIIAPAPVTGPPMASVGTIPPPPLQIPHPSSSTTLPTPLPKQTPPVPLARKSKVPAPTIPSRQGTTQSSSNAHTVQNVPPLKDPAIVNLPPEAAPYTVILAGVPELSPNTQEPFESLRNKVIGWLNIHRPLPSNLRGDILMVRRVSWVGHISKVIKGDCILVTFRNCQIVQLITNWLGGSGTTSIQLLPLSFFYPPRVKINRNPGGEEGWTKVGFAIDGSRYRPPRHHLPAQMDFMHHNRYSCLEEVD